MTAAVSEGLSFILIHIASLCLPVHSPSAASPERPTVAISPLRSQSSSPSRCPGQSGRPLSMVSPGPSLGPSPLSSPASRPILPLSSPLSCLTPPNVSAVLLNGESASPLQPPSPGPSHTPAQGVLPPKAEKVRFILADNSEDTLQQRANIISLLQYLSFCTNICHQILKKKIIGFCEITATRTFPLME